MSTPLLRDASRWLEAFWWTSILACSKLALAAPAPPLQERSDPQAEAVASVAADDAASGARIPADASPEARSRWERFAAGHAGTDAVRAPIRSFQLDFDLRVREPGSSNDVRAGFDYLVEPGWLRFRMTSSKREALHGPEGDWLIDGYGAQAMRGKDFARDRRQLSEFASIARNFVSLTRPEGIRVVSLAAYDGPGAPLPEALEDLSAQLEWVEARSPDLRLMAGDEELAMSPLGTLYRARFGIDPASGRARLAVLSEEAVRPTSDPLLVHIRAWAELDGYLVPSELMLHRWAERGFSPHPHAELFLRKGGRFNLEFAPEYFLPPR